MTFTDSLIDNLPVGIDRFILRALSFHKGKENAVSRAALLDDMHRYGMNDERQMRALINRLRKEGHLICSAGGTSGGYYLPASMDEYQEYRDRELHPRALDLLEQEKAMDKAAERQWGSISLQMRF